MQPRPKPNPARALVLVVAALWACSDSDAAPVDGGEPGSSAGSSTEGYPRCSDIAAEAGDAVDALVRELSECSDDEDCVLADVSPPSCTQRCPPVIAAEQRDALADGLMTINADHCLGAVGGCDWAAPSCLPAEPNCLDGVCVRTRAAEPALCPSGEPPELPPAGRCGDVTCAEGEFCCTTRGEPHFCTGPGSACAADLCPADSDAG